MQQADNSKVYLFDILRQIDPELTAQSEEALAFLNDDTIYSLDTDAFAEGMPTAEKLLAEVNRAETSIVQACGSEAFASARECAVNETLDEMIVFEKVGPTTPEPAENASLSSLGQDAPFDHICGVVTRPVC